MMYRYVSKEGICVVERCDLRQELMTPPALAVRSMHVAIVIQRRGDLEMLEQ